MGGGEIYWKLSNTTLFPQPSNQKPFLSSTVNIYVLTNSLTAAGCTTQSIQFRQELSIVSIIFHKVKGKVPSKTAFISDASHKRSPWQPALLYELATNSDVSGTFHVG